MSKGKRATLFSVIFIIIGMFCLAYASVPLYQLFCKATGFDGTPKIFSLNTQEKKGQRSYVIKFNTFIDPELPWAFSPNQAEIRVKSGETTLVHFTAENLTETSSFGTATFNVTPEKAAAYFNKVQCFCFEQQELKPHQKMVMPVTFFVDPEIENDPYLKDLTTLTLSYNFFKVKNPK